MNAHSAADLFPLLDGPEFDEFCADIREHGQRVPIVVHDGLILDGRNRWRACEAVGVEPIAEEWDGVGSPVAFVISVNLKRRHLDESQRAMVGARAKPMFEEEARARMLAGRADPSANLREGSKAADDAAQLVNVSPRSVESASKVLSEGVPELVAAVESGEVAVSTAAQIAELPQEEQRELVARGEKEILAAAKEIRAKKSQARREERITRLVEISAANDPLTGAIGQFPILYADPPWRYEHIETENRAIENQYPTMALDEICAMPVADCCTPDAILFLWTTSPKLEEAMRVVSAWGFTYRTNMVWVKDKIGMGYYCRAKHELLLICTRGEPPTPLESARPPSVIEAPRGKHSEKPSIFAELIEKMYPELPKLELFARSTRPGWESFGNQAKEAS